MRRRSELARLILTGVTGLALSACSTQSSTELPLGASPNGTGSSGSLNGTAGTGAPAAGTIAPKLIDDGTLTKGKYTGFNVAATDAQALTNSTTDPNAAPLKPNPPEPGTADGGSHAITFTGNGSTQVILAYGGTVPSLTYAFGQSGNTTSFNYSSVVLHATYAPGATSPGTLASIALELTGGTSPNNFDVRAACTTTGTLGAAAFVAYTCPLPAYPTNFATPATTNTVGPNAVTPGATGFFVPTAPKLYVVLNFSAPTAAASTGNVLGIDNVYAKQ